MASIQVEYESLSRSFQTIAHYPARNPDVAIWSISDVATRYNLHASGLARFAQSFGYAGFKAAAWNSAETERPSLAGKRILRTLAAPLWTWLKQRLTQGRFECVPCRDCA